MFDQILTTALGKYGVGAAVALYIFKTLFDLFSGNLLRYIKAIDANTIALQTLTKSVDEHFRVAFYNIKEIRDKTGMGPISKPTELDQ